MVRLSLPFQFQSFLVDDTIKFSFFLVKLQVQYLVALLHLFDVLFKLSLDLFMTLFSFSSLSFKGFDLALHLVHFVLKISLPQIVLDIDCFQCGFYILDLVIF